MQDSRNNLDLCVHYFDCLENCVSHLVKRRTDRKDRQALDPSWAHLLVIMREKCTTKTKIKTTVRSCDCLRPRSPQSSGGARRAPRPARGPCGAFPWRAPPPPCRRRDRACRSGPRDLCSRLGPLDGRQCSLGAHTATCGAHTTREASRTRCRPPGPWLSRASRLARRRSDEPPLLCVPVNVTEFVNIVSFPNITMLFADFFSKLHAVE